MLETQHESNQNSFMASHALDEIIGELWNTPGMTIQNYFSWDLLLNFLRN
jgi:hypothetical protein